MRKKKALPSAYAELTKDARVAGTFEVFVPVEGRARPHRVAMRFETKEKAEAWIHGPQGADAIAEILDGARK